MTSAALTLIVSFLALRIETPQSHDEQSTTSRFEKRKLWYETLTHFVLRMSDSRLITGTCLLIIELARLPKNNEQISAYPFRLITDFNDALN